MIKKIQITIGVIYIAILIVCIDLAICSFLYYVIDTSLNIQPMETPLPRSFSTIDLLWTESVYAEKKPVMISTKAYMLESDTLYYSNEAAEVSFSIAGLENNEVTGRHSVYRFISTQNAQSRFEKVFWGKDRSAPGEWDYISSIADQTRFYCYETEKEITTCKYQGLYEEYVSVLYIDWIPGAMDIKDIEQMVFEIDQIMAEHLQLELVE